MSSPIDQTTTKLGAGGRVVIPTGYRAALNLKPGDDLVLILEEQGLRIMSARAAIERAQALFARYVGKGRALSDELIADRREDGHAD